LKQRWKQAEFPLFVAAYEPRNQSSERPSLTHHLLGMIAATFTIKTHEMTVGSDDVDRLKRCGYLIEHPELHTSSAAKLYRELNELSEEVRARISPDFVQQVFDRASIELAVASIKARIQTLELAFIEEDEQ